MFVKEQEFGSCSHAGCEENYQGAACVFPFKYKGETYYQCTDVDDYDYWCSTCVDTSGLFTDDKAKFDERIWLSLSYADSISSDPWARLF